MLLNSNQIANHVIESDFSKRAQIGIDLSVCKIERIDVGSVVYKDKTHIDATGYHELPTQLIDGKDCWRLEKVYIRLPLTRVLKYLLTVLLKLLTVHLCTVQELLSNHLGGIQDSIVTK